MAFHFDTAWIKRYQTWFQNVFVDKTTHCPTEEQKKVLLALHCRIVKEEYETLQEPIPEEVWSTKPDDMVVDLPLLRLVHGLPGAGKSKVILWLKSYMEEVWLWEHGNQFAMVAPFNSMADNISGGTLHSFAGISFKDRRGIVLNSSQHMSDDRQSLLGEKWHN